MYKHRDFPHHRWFLDGGVVFYQGRDGVVKKSIMYSPRTFQFDVEVGVLTKETDTEIRSTTSTKS